MVALGRGISGEGLAGTLQLARIRRWALGGSGSARQEGGIWGARFRGAPPGRSIIS